MNIEHTHLIEKAIAQYGFDLTHGESALTTLVKWPEDARRLIKTDMGVYRERLSAFKRKEAVKVESISKEHKKTKQIDVPVKVE
jgi:hypothetical protein